ncbi:MAG: ATP synthase F1 subunit delta [Dehalococcoidales bacterium]|nr:ATP synthase F1 subunit delta [Dehalococcoidales bacterium]
MPRIASGKRYAQAAFELAMQRNELESWQVSLRKIAELSTDEAFTALVENPKLPFEVKKSLLEQRLRDVNPLALNLVCLLVHRGRLGTAGNVSREYDRLLDAYHGIEHAEVVTALSLDEKDKERISSQLGEMVNRKVIVDAVVDSSVIGGFKAKIGDMLIDGSVRNSLDALRRNLVEVSK